jgi:catalase-peroxidase
MNDEDILALNAVSHMVGKCHGNSDADLLGAKP